MTERPPMTVGIVEPRPISHLRQLSGGVPAAGGRAWVRRDLDATNTKLAIIDDDPTGTQTVRGVPLITEWDDDAIAWAMSEAAPTFAVLTNTRATVEGEAVAINRAIGERLVGAARRLGVQVRVISRSDSTLRGHFPAEPEALASGLGAGGEPIDGVVLCFAYPEAGRITVDDVHWVARKEQLVPAGQTEYAQDPAFGYRSSNLIDWVCERAGSHATVRSISLEEVRRGGPGGVAERLLALCGGARYVVANAVESNDLDVLAHGIALAEREGLRLVYRTGPSFLSARAGVAIADPLTAAEISTERGRGLVVVGSHTQLTTAQLNAASERHDIAMVMVDVEEVLAAEPAERVAVVRRMAAELRAALHDRDAALVTSRRSAHARRGASSLERSRVVGDALVDIVRAVAADTALRWLVAKGGITSHDIAVRALGVRRARVLGQLFFGQVSVWALGSQSLCPGLRYVVFPGNVGDELALVRTLDRLKGTA